MSTEKLANFIAETGYEQIPQEAIISAKKFILDGLGVALAGAVEPASKIMTQYVREAGGKPEAGVIAGGFRTDAANAALANGVMVHAVDYDDFSEGWQGHSTAVLLPTVLALGEKERVSGKAFLEAYVIGWEAGARISSVTPGLPALGWHGVSTIGTMGGGVAAAKILKLDSHQIRIALGIAGSQAGGLGLNRGTDTKPFHAGNAAKNAITAALLASKGFTANESILEGPLGLPKVFAGKECDPSKLTDGLGSSFDIVSPGGGIKRYPCCGRMHSSIDAMLYLVKEYHIRAEDVAEVRCETHPMTPRVCFYSRPKTGLEGKFSLQYCMAAALINGEVTLRHFTDDKVLSFESQELLKQIRVHSYDVEKSQLSEAGLSAPHRVTVELHDGRIYSREVRFHRGTPQNPMSWDEVAAKFKDCASVSLSTNGVEHSLDIVSGLEHLEDISRLSEILTCG